MEKLRDLSLLIDVPLLDATVAAFYGIGSKEERNVADQILQELQNNLDMWLQVIHILSSTHNLNTKFFALQESGLGLEHHLHRGRALAAFNHLLFNRVQLLILENIQRMQSGSSVHGQTNVQADVHTLLAPITQSEEFLLISV